jgi:hypothetical protein
MVFTTKPKKLEEFALLHQNAPRLAAELERRTLPSLRLARQNYGGLAHRMGGGAKRRNLFCETATSSRSMRDSSQ